MEEQEKPLTDEDIGSPPGEECGGRALQEEETAGAKVQKCSCSNQGINLVH